MTMIIDGTLGLDFPDGSDQSTAFTGNAATITSGTLAVARLPSSGVNAASITVGTLPAAQLPSSGVNAASITVGVLPQDNGGTGTTIGYNGFKNRIINGAMVIDQRNAGASVTPANGAYTYTMDRWAGFATQASKYTVQQNAGSVTPPVGFVNYLGATSSSAYSVTSGDLFMLTQFIEGYNTTDLGWGTANAKTVTLSFQVYSSLTGTFGGGLLNSAQNRTYPFTYSIPVANTWTTISVIIAGDTSGTWLKTNGVGIQVNFSLGAGSSYTNSNIGTWSVGGFTASGATSVVGTNGATFYITGVQLEKGSTATSFDYRPYGTEFQLCQRYFARMNALANYTGFATGLFDGGTTGAVIIKYPTTMRAAPTFSYSTLAVYDGNNVIPLSAIRTTYAGTDSMNQDIGVASGGTVNRVINLVANNSTSAFLALSAEL